MERENPIPEDVPTQAVNEISEIPDDQMDQISGGGNAEYAKYLSKLEKKYGVTLEDGLLSNVTRQELTILTRWRVHRKGMELPDMLKGTLD